MERPGGGRWQLGIPSLDWQVCYQSRVGPLEWLQPYTEDEIKRAAEGVPIVVVPIALYPSIPKPWSS